MNSKTIRYPLSVIRYGFTLVEMLVVITIIGVLASLVTVAAVAARQYVKVGIIKTEMSQIEMALEQYKNTHGEYPPDDFFDGDALVRHVKKRWPRFNLPGGSTQAACIRQAIDNIYTCSTMRSLVNSHGANWQNPLPSDDSALVSSTTSAYIGALPFWLGGIPGPDGKFLGFSADPLAPFGRSNASNTINNGAILIDDVVFDVNAMDKKTFIELKLGVNVVFVMANGTNGDNATFPVLVQSKSRDEYVPYVYFRGRSSGGNEAYVTGMSPKCYPFANLFADAWKTCGVAVAYARSGGVPFHATPANQTPVVWYEPERYQLIHPGLDCNFGGIGNVATVGTDPFDRNFFKTTNDNVDVNNLGQQDMDNIANFGGQGATIKSLLP